MKRCIELAKLGAGYTAPNPMVGAVLVHGQTIIGEGFHEAYGGSHAEVNCINSVPSELKHLISSSILYVSLEPCVHFGKTPPCTDLIILHKIPHVVTGCRDPFREVSGRGIEKLLAHGIKVEQDVLEEECKELNKRFFTFHIQHRPYIILKWAQTVNGKMGRDDNRRLYITGSLTNRLVHKWRSSEAAIMVGTNTALADNPQLTNRFWSGPSPVRIIIDRELRLPATLQIFDNATPTIVFNTIKHEEQENVLYYQVTSDVNMIHQVVNGLKYLNIISVLVEGGAQLLQSFIDEGIWDEARVITNETMTLKNGLAAPVLVNEKITGTEKTGNDFIRYYRPV